MNKLLSELFLGFFLIGAVGIIVLKLLQVNQFFVTACPIVLMLVYAYKYHSKPQRLRGRAGDNLYYLGFLYTLVSLGMSLFEFSLIDESIGKITQIITNFGIAIASTIFGIFFRVFFNLSEEDEEDETSKVSKAVSEFREQVSILNSELGEFSTFRIGLEQILRESSERQKEAISQFNASVTHFTKTIEEGREQFQVNLDSFVNTVSGLNERVSHLDNAVSASSDAISASVGAISANSESVAASVSDLVEKINRLQVPENLLEQLLRPSIQQIETGTEQIGEAGAKLANRLDNVRMPTDQLERRLQRASESVATSVSDLVEKINRLQVPENLLEQLLHPSIQQIETGAAEKTDKVWVPTDELEHHLQQTAAAVSASMSDLIKNTKNIQLPKGSLEQLLRPSIQQIETGAERIGKAREELANKIDTLQANNIDQGRLGKLVGKKIANKINLMQLPEGSLEQLLRPSIQQIETGAERIGKAGAELANKINKVRVPPGELEHHLQQTAAEISARMSDLVEKINSMQVAEDPREQSPRSSTQRIKTGTK